MSVIVFNAAAFESIGALDDSAPGDEVGTTTSAGALILCAACGKVFPASACYCLRCSARVGYA